MKIDENEILSQQLEKLKLKFSKEKQSLSCHLERLNIENALSYSDYLNIDLLLNLQKPKTDFPDEKIFIVYHQIVELYFNLIIWEIKQMTNEDKLLPPEIFEDKINRVSRYFENVISSFTIMSEGMDKKQFLKFRYALFPASGFQSLQYRVIEALSTNALNLVSIKWRKDIVNEDTLQYKYSKIYWKRGAVDVTTGEKTITLTSFEKSYDELLLNLLSKYKNSNVYQMFQKHYADLPESSSIKLALRKFDQLANVKWPRAHYNVAMHHLARNKSEKVQSTGGTNWSKYLNPRFQKISFFPEIWKKEELEAWGA